MFLSYFSRVLSLVDGGGTKIGLHKAKFYDTYVLER